MCPPRSQHDLGGAVDSIVIADRADQNLTWAVSRPSWITVGILLAVSRVEIRLRFTYCTRGSSRGGGQIVECGPVGERSPAETGEITQCRSACEWTWHNRILSFEFGKRQLSLAPVCSKSSEQLTPCRPADV